uniref:Uncharacterized protein n=1 Tax=Steinernema glaseri TaxID=37863 RepID=A0A1I7Z6R1_9BILA
MIKKVLNRLLTGDQTGQRVKERPFKDLPKRAADTDISRESVTDPRHTHTLFLSRLLLLFVLLRASLTNTSSTIPRRQFLPAAIIPRRRRLRHQSPPNSQQQPQQ